MPRRRRRRAWGAGSVYEVGAGRWWAIRWREQGMQRRKSGFRTREDAERVLHKIRGDIALGAAGLPPDPATAPRLREVVDDFLTRRKTTHRAARRTSTAGRSTSLRTSVICGPPRWTTRACAS